MSKLVRGILGLIGGYGVAATLGWMAILAFSSNNHDRSVEAAMTAIFFAGPLGAILGLVAALIWKGPSSRQGKGATPP
jgi:hypothetical protein